jgi:lipoyl synthase
MTQTALPPWIKRPLPATGELEKMKSAFRKSNLHTVCESARCPNIGECFSSKTATYMINGNICTRVCGFCDVKSGKPLVQDPEEPKNIAASVLDLGIEYSVITAVNRDDLKDGGAEQFKKVAKAIDGLGKNIEVEFLIPDFNGKIEPLITVLEALPVVLNHNLETVERITPDVRNKAQYKRSLQVLSNAKIYGKSQTKTGIMVGLGEKREECVKLFDDVAKIECDILTIGQYLSPGKDFLKVARYLEPDEFEELKILAIKAGIKTVYSGPFVRSSFNAKEVLAQSKKK